MFSKVKIDDKVYHIRLGWGDVVKVTQHHCYVRFSTRGITDTHYFEFDGRVHPTDQHPTLYWNVPTIIVPKRKVKREGWVNIYPRRAAREVLGASGSIIYKSREKAVSEASADIIDTVKIEWEEFE